MIGPLTTALEPTEVLASASWPAAAPGTVAVTRELAFRSGDYAIVGVAVQLTLRDEAILDVRIGLFGVGSTPVHGRGPHCRAAPPSSQRGAPPSSPAGVPSGARSRNPAPP